MSYLVFGATGLVGSELIEILAGATCVVRKQGSTSHPEILLEDIEKSKESFEGVFCCLGTTIKKAKSKEAFKKVDLDLVLKSYEHAKEIKAKFFCVISSLGADKNSNVFYSKVKGLMEESLDAKDIKVIIVRPSLLVGKRKEFRLSESIGIKLFGNIKSITPKKYKHLAPIKAQEVAKAMVDLSLNDETSVDIEYQIKNPLN